MLYTVVLFSAFSVVPLIHGSYQITGDPSDPFKGSLFELIVEIRIVSVQIDVESFNFSVILLL